MPLPNFVPLIGSGFDSLAQQQQHWAGFSANIENQNIQRDMLGQEAENRWLEQAARARDIAQQRDLENQLNADAIARGEAGQHRQEAEAKRQFDIGVALDKERVKATNTRTEEMSKVADLNAALQQHAAEQKIESVGQAAANNFLILQNTAEAARAAHEKVQKQEDEILASIEQEKLKKKPDASKLSTLLMQQKTIAPQLRLAASDHLKAQNNFERLHNGLTNQGFDIDTANEQIVHTPTGKKWSFKAALDTAKAKVEDGFQETSPGSGWLRPVPATGPGDTPPPTWAGFSPGTNTATSPVAPSLPPVVAPSPGTNGMRIGRFVVTPQ